MVQIGSVFTTITFKNPTTGVLVNEPVTFGQTFSKGDFPATGAGVELRAPNNSVVPCQIDVKATFSDGSVRHAILSAIIPSLAASASDVYGIVRKTAVVTTAVTPSAFPGLNATVLLNDHGTELAGPNAGTAYTADASVQLAGGDYQTHLSGPICSEWIIRAPLKTAGGVEHPDLHARFSIRAYANQSRAKIDYVIENTWAKRKAVPSGNNPWENATLSPRIYAVSFKAGATTVYVRSQAGYIRTRLTNTPSGVYDSNSTGLPNDATVYTATIRVDGVDYPINITGSAAQKYLDLRNLINAQLNGAAICSSDVEGMNGLIFRSATTGPTSLVTITYGTLFPALGHAQLVGTTQYYPYRPIQGDEVLHHAYARWKKTFWWGAETKVHVAHNKSYLTATRSVPNYPSDISGSNTQIATNLVTLKANEDIGQNGLTKALMSDVGYAPGIGVLPEWTAMYLINQDVDAKYTMLKQADLQGSWSIHARDYTTDRPINFVDYPYATLVGQITDSYNSATGLYEKLPAVSIPTCIPNNRNVADTSHHPCFCFVPYMVTGDHYYLEGLLFYSRFVGLNSLSHLNYRDGRKCLWKGDQPRGQAWSLRTMVHAAYITPDDHPLKSDILYSLEQNRLWYATNYLDPAGQYFNQLGFIYHGYGLAYSTSGGASTGAAPWMNHFITSAAGRAVELGFTEFLPLLNFVSKCVVGLMTSGSDYCWQVASWYSLRLKASASSSVLYTTYKEVYDNTMPAGILAQECGTAGMTAAIGTAQGYTIPLNSMAGYPATIAGYPAVIQAALAYCVTFGTPNADNGWLIFDNRAAKPDYNLGPQFGIVPRVNEVAAITYSPPDVYAVTTGLPIYGGKAKPVTSNGAFDKVDVALESTDGLPGNTSTKILIFSLHGSSGQNITNGRQYDATVSGPMAYDIHNVFRFSTVLSTVAGCYLLRPVDWYGSNANGTRKESMWLGFKNMPTGDVALITERRLDALVQWAEINLQYVAKKTVLTGGSMGGWGTLTFGVSRRNKFAALYPDRPRWKYSAALNNVAVANYNGALENAPVATPLNLVAADGGGSYITKLDIIAYVSNTANKIPWIGWCVGRNDGFTNFSDHVAAVAAMRTAKRGFAFAWNDGNHTVGSIQAQIVNSYPWGTFEIGKGYPLFTQHSGDQDPAVDLVGGINLGLSFRNVVETASGWSCEVTSIAGARTVKVEPISDVFITTVAAKLITIPAANTWVPVSFTA
jgi:hypothetical protein